MLSGSDHSLIQVVNKLDRPSLTVWRQAGSREDDDRALESIADDQPPSSCVEILQLCFATPLAAAWVVAIIANDQ
jgi:hypothetical protein